MDPMESTESFWASFGLLGTLMAISIVLQDPSGIHSVSSTTFWEPIHLYSPYDLLKSTKDSPDLQGLLLASLETTPTSKELIQIQSNSRRFEH